LFLEDICLLVLNFRFRCDYKVSEY